MSRKPAASLNIPTEWASMLDTAKYTVCHKYEGDTVTYIICEGEVSRAGMLCIGYPTLGYAGVVTDVARDKAKQLSYGKEVIIIDEVKGGSRIHYWPSGTWKQEAYGTRG
jgi:hypothetical protein